MKKKFIKFKEVTMFTGVAVDSLLILGCNTNHINNTTIVNFVAFNSKDIKENQPVNYMALAGYKAPQFILNKPATTLEDAEVNLIEQLGITIVD